MSPSRLLAVHGPLVPSLGFEVGGQLGQGPDSLLQLQQISEFLDRSWAHQTGHLDRICDNKVDPGYPSANELLLPQQVLQLIEEITGPSPKSAQGLFPCHIGWGLVGQSRELRLEIFVDSIGSGQKHLFLGVSPQQVQSIGLVADIDDDGSAFSDDFLAIEQVGQGECCIFGEVFGLIHLEPLILIALLVPNLLVGEASVFQKMANPLGEPTNGPVPQHQLITHKICYILWIELVICMSHHHFQAAMQLLQGLSLKRSDEKQPFSQARFQTRFWYSSNLGKALRYSSLRRLRVCRQSAKTKSNQVSPPAIYSLSPRIPSSLARQGQKVLMLLSRAWSKVLFSSYRPQTIWMYLGWKSLQTPWAVKRATCSSALRPSRSVLSALWQRYTQIASLSETNLSPSRRQGSVTAGFLGMRLCFTSWTHLALPSAPSYLCSVQGMERYSMSCLARSERPRMAQQPNTTPPSIRYVLDYNQQSGKMVTIKNITKKAFFLQSHRPPSKPAQSLSSEAPQNSSSPSLRPAPPPRWGRSAGRNREWRRSPCGRRRKRRPG